jgi:hypothetical protein
MLTVISVRRQYSDISLPTATCCGYGVHLKLYTLLDNISTLRFTNSRLQLPCIAFSGHRAQTGAVMTRRHVTYDVKADGLQDPLITTKGQADSLLTGKAYPADILAHPSVELL